MVNLWDAVSNHWRRVRASDTPTPEDRPKFCSQHSTGFRSGLLGGQRSGGLIFNSGVALLAQIFDVRGTYVHDDPARCTAGSALIVMATVAAGTPLY